MKFRFRSTGTALAAGLLLLAGAAAAATPPRPIRAQLTPRRFTTLSAEIPARIRKIHVTESGAFKAGQPLVSLDCTLQSAQLQKSQAELAAAQKTYQANQRLKELNSIGSVELDNSQSAVRRANAEVAFAGALLSRCVIRAPFSGRVAEQKAREQQYVQAGQPLLEIIDDSAFVLEFLAPSSAMTWLRPGAAFSVRIDETGRTYSAKVVRLGARIDPVSQSVKVRGEIQGDHPDLLAGMSGVVLLAPK